MKKIVWFIALIFLAIAGCKKEEVKEAKKEDPCSKLPQIGFSIEKATYPGMFRLIASNFQYDDSTNIIYSDPFSPNPVDNHTYIPYYTVKELTTNETLKVSGSHVHARNYVLFSKPGRYEVSIYSSGGETKCLQSTRQITITKPGKDRPFRLKRVQLIDFPAQDTAKLVLVRFTNDPNYYTRPPFPAYETKGQKYYHVPLFKLRKGQLPTQFGINEDFQSVQSISNGDPFAVQLWFVKEGTEGGSLPPDGISTDGQVVISRNITTFDWEPHFKVADYADPDRLPTTFQSTNNGYVWELEVEWL